MTPPARQERRSVQWTICLCEIRWPWSPAPAGELARRLPARLAEFGAKVVITDINMETAQRVVDDIIAQGGQAKCVLFNVADFDHIKEKVEEIKGLFGRIDVWVNNAGITGSTPIEEISLESWDKMMNIDLKAMFFCTQAVFAIMKEQNYGKLVHMSSLGGAAGRPKF